jgi:hypothetical protein
LKGNIDKEILKKLGLLNMEKYLNITIIENCNYSTYENVFKDMNKDSRLIFSVHIGKFKKPRSTLILHECHFMVCRTNHNYITYANHHQISNV